MNDNTYILPKIITSLHFTTQHFTVIHFISLHFGTLHSPFFTSPHFWTFRHHDSKILHFASLIITFPKLVMKIFELQGKVASSSAGSPFNSVIVLFTEQNLPMSVLCFVALILQSWSSVLRQSFKLSPLDFHACSPVNALSRGQMRSISLRCAKVSHSESFVWFANLANSLAHGLTRLSDPPCTGPRTKPHIQESDTLVTCRLHVSYYFFLFNPLTTNDL
jgi:hypothetical protein